MKRTAAEAFIRAAMAAAYVIAAAVAGAQSGHGDLALVDATVYPAPNVEPIRHATVLVHDGAIVGVGPGGSISIPTGARRIDCRGKTVTAGFWNSHVHILLPGLLHAREAPAAGLSARLDSMLNRWGFTTVFDIASPLDNTLALRRRIDSGVVRGPRILTAGEPLWTKTPVYVRDFLAANSIRMDPVTSSEQAVARVRDLAARGVDGIKLFTGSYQGGGNVANMPLDMVRAASAEAHRHDLPVFAHPQNAVGLQNAVQGGVNVLAHTVPDSPPWTASLVARLRKAHIALIPTLTLFDVEARKDGASANDRDAFVGSQVAELRAFAAGGGVVLFGTDVGYIDQFDSSEEFELMARAGMSFRQVLASLTTNPAAVFHVTRKGRVARGMDADLVVLDEDPSLDVLAFAKVDYVIRGGTVVFHALSIAAATKMRVP